MAYSTPGTGIIYELLDDEIILANLDAGIYYSIRGSGIVIWHLLIAGQTPLAVEALFTEKYGSISSISPFIEQLLAENLLVEKESSPPPSPPLSWPSDFSPPTLERYDEMKDLLMLDPIHEVDEQGWPQRK